MRFDPSIEIACSEGVYEPAEDSRMMIEAIPIEPGCTVFEAGCGSGIVALHCAKAGAEVIASDISPDALECTRENAARNGLDIEAIEGDLLDGASGEYDLIVFNPPYLPEGGADDAQWTGGRTGLEITVRFLEQCGGHLAPGGKAYAIVSSLAGFEDFEEAAERLGFRFKVANKKRIFFEELAVYELSRDPEG